MPRYEFSEINEEHESAKWFSVIDAKDLTAAVNEAAEKFYEETGDMHAQFLVSVGGESKIIEVTSFVTRNWGFTEVPRKDGGDGA